MDQKEFKNRTQYLDKSKVVYVYCQSGGRSASAQAALIEAGYQVVNLEGGMSNWRMQQMPVEGAGNIVQMRVTDFDKIIQNNQYVLVDIGATWCPPCRKMQPTIDQIKKEQGKNLYFLAVDGGVDMDVMKHVQFEAYLLLLFIRMEKKYGESKVLLKKESLIKCFLLNSSIAS